MISKQLAEDMKAAMKSGDKKRLSTLRLVCHGAAPVSIDVKRRMIDWLGPVLFEFYGGTEGGGVAEVLLRKPNGRVNFDFKGKLSFSWPQSPEQTVLNYGDEDYNPLFAYGFGLTYADQAEQARALRAIEATGITIAMAGITRPNQEGLAHDF